MKTPAQPKMRFLGTVGGVATGTVHMTGNSPWEMHPDGDECLSLVSGEIDVIIEDRGPGPAMVLRAGGACVIPRGQWHRLVTRQPGDLIFLTPTAGTRHRVIDAPAESPGADTPEPVRSPERPPQRARGRSKRKSRRSSKLSR